MVALGADHWPGVGVEASAQRPGCGSGEPGIAPRASSLFSTGKAGAAAAPLQRAVGSFPPFRPWGSRTDAEVPMPSILTEPTASLCASTRGRQYVIAQ